MQPNHVVKFNIFERNMGQRASGSPSTNLYCRYMSKISRYTPALFPS